MSKNTAVMSEEWIKAIPENYPDAMPEGAIILSRLWATYDAAVKRADALSGGKDAIRAAAMNLFRESGDPAVAKLDALASKIAEITSQLADMQATYNDAVDAATTSFTEQATKDAAENGSNYAEAVKAARHRLNNGLLMTFEVDSLKDIPGLPVIPQRKRETDDSAPAGWSPRLASAAINGVQVPNADGKEFPTMETVKVALGISKPTREFSAFLLSQNNNARELGTDGTTVQVKINGEVKSIVLVPRVKAEGK